MAKKVRKEITPQDTHNLLEEFFGFTKKQFEKMEEKMEGKFDNVNRTLILTNEQLNHVRIDVRDLKEGQYRIEKDIKMLKEDVVAVGKSIYKQHRTLENHGRRLVELENTK